MLNVVQIQTAAIILILSYFIGNFQTAVLFSKRFLHDDVRQHGSGNPGASNMTRVFGTKWGVLTFLGDAFKCFLGVALGAYLGRWWGIAVQKSAMDFTLGAYIGGLGVVLGHCWPVLYRFRGGKGVACFFAFMFLTFPLGGGIVHGGDGVLGNIAGHQQHPGLVFPCGVKGVLRPHRQGTCPAHQAQKAQNLFGHSCSASFVCASSRS